MKHTDNRTDYDNCLAAFKALPQLVALGENEAGFQCYTTTALYEKEDSLIESACQLRNTAQPSIARQSIADAIKIAKLNAEQAIAVRDIINGGQLSCLVGRAGTGKSYTAKALNAIYQSAGYRVLGAATAGIAAHGLEEASDIKSKVLTSLCYSLRKGHIRLSDKDVVLVDEAGMVELTVMSDVVQAVKSAGAKLVLVGDPDQLPAIGQGNPFTAIIEQVGFCELANIQRQEREADCQASRLLAGANRGNAFVNVNAALSHYQEQGALVFADTAQATHKALLQDWLASQASTPLAEQLILAYRRDDVFTLNEKARLRLIETGALGQEEWPLYTSHGVRPTRQGERLLCTRNKNSLGLVNGQFVTLMGLTKTHINLKLENGDTTSIALADYAHFEYGYAVTVHKSQGMSIKNVFVAATGRGWDRFLTYVALTRHKAQLKLYTNKQENRDLQALSRHMARGQVLDSILRYPLSFARRHGLNPDKVLTRFITHVGEKVENIKDKWAWLAGYGALAERKLKRVERQIKAIEGQRARVVAGYVSSHLTLGHQRKALYAKLDKDETLSKKWAQLDLGEREKARHAAFYAHPDYVAIYYADLARNEKATHLYDNLVDYEDALGINRVDIQKLEREREQHRLYAHVQQYALSNSQTEREKLAYVIVYAAKAHHRYVTQTPDVDWQALRLDAKTHEVAMVFERAGVAEQQAITQVEAYLSDYKQAQAAWKAYFNDGASAEDLSELTPVELEAINNKRDSLLDSAKTLTHQRDKAAYDLWQQQNNPEHTLALMLFDICEEDNTPRFSPSTLRKQRHIPQYRHTRLQQYAARYEARQTVAEYMTLCQQLHEPQHTARRLQLASTIHRYRKLHNGQVYETFAKDDADENKRSVWQQLKRDAELARLVRLEKNATPDEKAFLTMWREFASCQQQRQALWQAHYGNDTPGKPSEHINTVEQQYLTCLQNVRDCKNYRVLAKRHQVSLAPLDAVEDKLAAKIRVETYAAPNTSLRARALLAETIYAELPLHIAHLKIANIPVYKIKQQVEKNQRRVWLGTLTQAERRDAGVAAQFVRLSAQRRRAWQRYFALKESGANKTPLRAAYEATQDTQAKLDSISHTISQAPSRYGHFVALYNIKLDKLREHQASYSDFLRSIEVHITKRNALMAKALPWQNNIETLIKEDALEFSFWFDEWAQLMRVQNTLQKKVQQYPTLKEIKTLFEHDLRFTDIITQHKQAALAIANTSVSLAQNGGPDTDGAKKVNKYWTASTPLTGTLAERYLSEHRHIQTVNSDNVRFIANSYNHILKQSYPCLVLFMRDKDNEIVACQRTFLDEKTGNKIQSTPDEKRAAKLSRNAFPEALKNAPLSLSKPSAHSRPIVLAEGFETGASVAQAKPDWDVRVVFGVRNFKNLAPAITDKQPLIIAMDNDARKHDKDIQEAAIALHAKGYAVKVVEPVSQNTDFNDVLKTEGKTALLHELNNERHFHMSPTVQMDIQAHTQIAAESLCKQLTQLQTNIQTEPNREASEIELPQPIFADERDFDKRMQAINWHEIERSDDVSLEDLQNQKALYDKAKATSMTDNDDTDYYLRQKEKLVKTIIKLSQSSGGFDKHESLHPVVADTLRREADYHIRLRQAQVNKYKIAPDGKLKI
jgi:hypothetical protein